MPLTTLTTQTAGGTASASGWANVVKANFDVLIAAWTVYTPTLTNITLGTGGTATGSYLQMGKTVIGRVLITLGTGGAFTGSVTVSLPVVASAILLPIGAAEFYDSSADTYYMGYTRVNNPTTSAWFQGHAITGHIGATTPFTWASGDQLQCVLTYETA